MAARQLKRTADLENTQRMRLVCKGDIYVNISKDIIAQYENTI